MQYDIVDFENQNIYDRFQIHEIEKGIINEIDIRYYLGENFNGNQMFQIRSLLEYKKETGRQDIEISLIANKHFSYGQMGELKRAYQSGLSAEQVMLIANPEITRMQMSQLREMFLDGATIDEVRNVAFPLYIFEHLWVIREIYKAVDDKSMLPDELYDWNLNIDDILKLRTDILKNTKEERKGIRAKLEEIRKRNSNNEKKSNLQKDQYSK